MARPKKTPSAHPEQSMDAEVPAEYGAQQIPATPAIQTLPLFSLVLSELNVRRTERDADVAALAEDIAARGLKQNLVVIPAHFSTAETDQNFGDKFEVIAGGRRFQALKLLADAGRIEPDHPIPVLVEARTEARETSLSENLHRVAMNPADEFEAFAQISTAASHEPDPIAYTAKRFGVTQRHVRERLRLASLAPEILTALRENRLPVDAAKAYAGTEDHELQLKVFKANEKANYNKHNPREVREALRGATLPLSAGRVKFVGIEAYRAAGGTTETEMFMGTDGEERLTDVALLDRLCAEKAEPLLAAQAAKDGYASALFAAGGKCPKPPRGMVKVGPYEYRAAPDAEKAQRIAVYAVNFHGDGLSITEKFKPVEAAKRAADSTYKPMTDEERAQKLHDDWVQVWAARLALGSFTGTPLEGKGFWPGSSWPPNLIEFEYLEDDRDQEPVSAMIKVEIRVTAAEMIAQLEAAAALVSELETAEAERQAQLKTEREAEREARAAEQDEDDDGGEFDEDEKDEA